MDQSWHENKHGGDGAMDECFDRAHGLDQAASRLSSEAGVDGTILIMELLEELPPSDLDLEAAGDVDNRLSHVIRSLEAEIGGAVMGADGASTAGPSSEGEGGFVEDMLLDLGAGGYEAGSFGFWMPEAPLVMGHVAEGWYLYADDCEGTMVGCMDQQYQYVEEVYSPLWE